MTTESLIHQQFHPTATATPPAHASLLLQRRCACGGTPGPDGECAECRKKRLGLQRKAADRSAAPSVPPIVNDVLRSPGQPLDAGVRAFMEPRLGHDFGRVRVHTDARAAASARAVCSLAYTVGRDVVFGEGQYAPQTSAGRRLLAHELTHVVQQGDVAASQGALRVGPAKDVFEQEAEAASAALEDGSPGFGVRPFRSGRPTGVIQRAAVHRGNILDEGDCQHLACRSKWACVDDATGVECPENSRNSFKRTGHRYRPLFTCDVKCENNRTCSDTDNWMAVPAGRFAYRKCGQDLVICANGRSTHARVRDKSEIEAWEVSRGIQDALGVPHGTFSGAVYGDESDAAFKTDERCHGKAASPKSETPQQSEPPPPGEPLPAPVRDNPSDVIGE